MKHPNISEEIVSFIMSRNLDQLSRLTCYKIAENFGVNNSYLSGRFKKDTKMSLSEFIEFEKMIRVRTLLKDRSDLTIQDISKLYGLEKVDQFRAKFKKFFYITPGRYRFLNGAKN